MSASGMKLILIVAGALLIGAKFKSTITGLPVVGGLAK